MDDFLQQYFRNVKAGNVESVEEIINSYPEFTNCLDEKNQSGLNISATHGHKDIVQLLLDKGANVNIPDMNGWTPLHKAVVENHFIVVQILLKSGADMGLTTTEGHTPLDWASTKGHTEIVKYLLDSGANINYQNQTGGTALHWAAMNGNSNTVVILLEYGANINSPNNNGSTALHFACDRGNLHLARLLIKNGADIFAVTKDGRTPLHRAAGTGRPEIIKVLLDHKVDINCRTQDGDTPLHLSCMTEKPDTVSLLLDRGADVTITNNIGDTPLHTASSKGRTESVLILLKRGEIFVDAMNMHGQTPLHLAAANGKKASLWALISHGADVNIADKYGDPALHPEVRVFESTHPYASNTRQYIPIEIRGAKGYIVEFDPQTSTQRNSDYVKFYRDRGYSSYFGETIYTGGLNGSVRNFPGLDGKPPLEIDKKSFIFYFTTDASVVDWGYRMKVTPKFLSSEKQNGWTPLMWAAYTGRLDLTRPLLDQGTQLECCDWDGNTALSLAIQTFRKPVALLLVRLGARLDIPNKENITAIEFAVQNEFSQFLSALLKDFHPFINDDETTLKEGAAFVWQQLLANTESYMVEVNNVLERYSSRLLALAYSVDKSGRRSIDVARPVYKKLIVEKLYFCKRYDMKEGPPEHKSATCVVRLAIDHGVENDEHLNDHKQQSNQVALKFMANKDQFEREISVRSKGNFNEEFVIQIIRYHDSDQSIEFKQEIERKEFYPYCIVMPAAERNLSTILAHEHIAGRDWHQIKVIGFDIITALQHLHDKNLIHGDIKGLNIVRSAGRYKLIDLDASVPLIEGSYSGAKYSSAFIPPEMIFCYHNVDKEVDEIVIRSYTVDASTGKSIPDFPGCDLIPANIAHDMWSLGVVLFHLFTGEPLFKANDEDNLDQQNLRILYDWTDSYKKQSIMKIQNPQAKNLVSRLLSKDPKKRPDTSRISSHSFFTGKKATRMIGENSSYDVFISYRVASESFLAEALYEILTSCGLKVWWDKKCLEPGQKWEEGFCDGLIDSAVFVPLISKEGINNEEKSWQDFSKLTKDSLCDNVLLEHRLALELKEMGLIEAIFPILIGESHDSGSYTNRLFSRFNCFCPPLVLPEVSVLSVEEKVLEHLERQGLGAPIIVEATVKSVYKRLISFQGGFLEGRGQHAMSALGETIRNICKSLKNEDNYNEMTPSQNHRVDNSLLDSREQQAHYPNPNISRDHLVLNSKLDVNSVDNKILYKIHQLYHMVTDWSYKFQQNSGKSRDLYDEIVIITNLILNLRFLFLFEHGFRMRNESKTSSDGNVQHRPYDIILSRHVTEIVTALKSSSTSTFNINSSVSLDMLSRCVLWKISNANGNNSESESENMNMKTDLSEDVNWHWVNLPEFSLYKQDPQYDINILEFCDAESGALLLRVTFNDIEERNEWLRLITLTDTKARPEDVQSSFLPAVAYNEEILLENKFLKEKVLQIESRMSSISKRLIKLTDNFKDI